MLCSGRLLDRHAIRICTKCLIQAGLHVVACIMELALLRGKCAALHTMAEDGQDL